MAEADPTANMVYPHPEAHLPG